MDDVALFLLVLDVFSLGW